MDQAPQYARAAGNLVRTNSLAPESMTESVAGYLQALRSGNVAGVLALLDDQVVFRSPFHTWRGQALRRVYTARAVAFHDFEVDAVIADPDHAVLMWRATVGTADVEASEVLTLRDDTIRRIDVFLRPAVALESVYQAMVATWPSPGPQNRDEPAGRIR